MSNGLEDFSLFDLFRMEAEEQVRVLQSGLIELESGAATAATLEALMRAAHSLKGAARIVGLDAIVNLTHVVEDRFVAAQHGRALDAAEVDRMLTATDWLARLQAVPENDTAAWFETNAPAIEAFAAAFAEETAQQGGQASAPEAPQNAAPHQPPKRPASFRTVSSSRGRNSGCDPRVAGAGRRHLRPACTGRRPRACSVTSASPPRPLRQDHVDGLRDAGGLADTGGLWWRVRGQATRHRPGLQTLETRIRQLWPGRRHA